MNILCYTWEITEILGNGCSMDALWICIDIHFLKVTVAKKIMAAASALYRGVCVIFYTGTRYK